ncbi:MAG: ECF-type sigma factor [Bryobacteraceae bacterium]
MDVNAQFTELYQELRRIARYNLDARLRNGALQPTELLNEAYLRLAAASDLRVEDRAHFMALACRAMRLVLVDTLRASSRDKRGGGQLIFITLGSAAAPAETCDTEAFLDLDAALTRLLALNENQGRIVELHYFAGLSYVEIAAELAISEATVHRHLRMAKAWLAHELAAKK